MTKNKKYKMFGFNTKDYPDFYGKCLECNNETYHLYVLAEDMKEAKELLKYERDGVCGNCMCSRLIELGEDGWITSK